MQKIPNDVEFKLIEMPNYSFKVKNRCLLGRTIDDFNWYPVTSFSVEDIETGKCGYWVVDKDNTK